MAIAPDGGEAASLGGHTVRGTGTHKLVGTQLTSDVQRELIASACHQLPDGELLGTGTDFDDHAA